MSHKFILAAIFLCALAGAGHAQPVGDNDVQRGQYLATAGDCVACHTAPRGIPFAGGTVIATPFGKLVGPNITPDPTTGIGGWTDDQFVRAVKFGYGHNVGYLYPGLPYIYFNNVTRADILDIHAYLDSLAPVHQKIVADQLPFPYDIRKSMFFWDQLYFPDKGDYRQNPAKSAAWNRGAYLVQGLGHCAACHTSKNFLGGDHTGNELGGAVLDGWNAPALQDGVRTGLGAWLPAEIAAYLKTGHNQYADASGPMADVVYHSTSHLNDDDLAAIATYLKDDGTIHETTASALNSSDPQMQLGAAIYADECAACHTQSGAGAAKLFPTLAGNAQVQSDNPATLIRVLLTGAQSVGTPQAGAAAMPAFAWQLDDAQSAAVLTYIRNGWGNAAQAVSAGQVSDVRGKLKS
jgi:mono/diheme cytochrome c family protein